MRRILQRAGFVLDRTRGDHEQWEGVVGGQRRVVTLDAGGEPFADRERVTRSMISQSGLSADEFYALHEG